MAALTTTAHVIPIFIIVLLVAILVHVNEIKKNVDLFLEVMAG